MNRSLSCWLTGHTHNLNIKFADFLAQGVAVYAEQLGCFYLIAPGRCQTDGEKRFLYVFKNTLIEPFWWKLVPM